MKIPIEVSARHIHLSKKDAEKLFGKNYELKKLKDLSQKTDFAAKETVFTQGEKGAFPKVRIIGPYRANTQLEISKTDAISLGIKPVLRVSGNIKKTPGITIKGPKGTINIKQGAMITHRHLHASTKDAKKLGLKQNDFVGIKIGGEREIIFNKVIVRVNPGFGLSLHLDADEANAAGVDSGNNVGELIKSCWQKVFLSRFF